MRKLMLVATFAMMACGGKLAAGEVCTADDDCESGACEAGTGTESTCADTATGTGTTPTDTKKAKS